MALEGIEREADELRRRLAAIVEGTDDAIVSIDPELTITSWNRGAERMYGWTADEAVGRRFGFHVPPDVRDYVESRVVAVLSGENVDPFETERLRADGARLEVSVTVSPVRDPEGNTVGAASIARDITWRRRALEAQEFLAEASVVLDATLDPDAIVQRLAELAVPRFAELVVIDLVRADGSIGDAAVAAVDPAAAAELAQIRRKTPLDPRGRHPVAEVVRTGHSLVVRDLRSAEAQRDVPQSEQHRDFMRRAGYASAAVAPLVARGRTLGALSLLHIRNDLRYDPADLTLFEDLAARAALALDNARLYAERVRVARVLQESLLPGALPNLPGAEVAAAYRPAGRGDEVGGDFYDVFPGADGEQGAWMLAIGDVCGKGADAAAATALVRHSLRALSLERDDPEELLGLANRAMLRADLDGRFCTALLGVVSTDRRPVEVRLATAGHPPPAIVRADGDVVFARQRGAVLGVQEEARFGSETVVLEPGDALVLYTDGVLDCAAPDRLLGEREIYAALAPLAGQPANRLVGALMRLVGETAGAEARDDVAVLALRVNP